MHEYLTTILQPFLKIRNPKKIAPYRKVRSFFYVSLMESSTRILFYAFTLPCLNPLYIYVHTARRPSYRLRDARTVLSLPTSPSSKQYPSIPHLRAPSIFRFRSSTKKHSSVSDGNGQTDARTSPSAASGIAPLLKTGCRQSSQWPESPLYST